MSIHKQIPNQLLYEHKTQQSWLLHNSRIHGVAHMMRVFILQELICDQLEAKDASVDRLATRWAASAHDVGRVDDGVDLEHGRRSAQWMNDDLRQSMSPETLDTATYAVHWHVPTDSDAPVMTAELKVLKDADALDRVRLGDLDESYLRTDAARGLVDTARQLYEASQPDSPHENESFDTVLAAAIKLKLVTS